MTQLVINDTGEVVVSSGTPANPEDLQVYNQALGGLGSTEISIKDGGELWFSGAAEDGQLMVSELANDMAGGTVVFGGPGGDVLDASTGDYFVGGPGNDSIFMPNTSVTVIGVEPIGSDVYEVYDYHNDVGVVVTGVENILTPVDGISVAHALLLF